MHMLGDPAAVTGDWAAQEVQFRQATRSSKLGNQSRKIAIKRGARAYLSTMKTDKPKEAKSRTSKEVVGKKARQWIQEGYQLALCVFGKQMK